MSTTLERPSTVLERLRPSERGTIEPDRFREEIRDLAEFIESTPSPPEPTEPNPFAIAETKWQGSAEQPELNAVPNTRAGYELRDLARPCTCPACMSGFSTAAAMQRYCNCSGPRSAFLGR